MNDLQAWRLQRDSEAQPLPWWLWPVTLLWRRQQIAEQDTVPVPVPQYVDTVPTDRAPL